MSERGWTRRRFLWHTAAVGLGAMGLPYVVPSSALGKGNAVRPEDGGGSVLFTEKFTVEIFDEDLFLRQSAPGAAASVLTPTLGPFVIRCGPVLLNGPCCAGSGRLQTKGVEPCCGRSCST